MNYSDREKESNFSFYSKAQCNGQKAKIYYLFLIKIYDFKVEKQSIASVAVGRV